jgi:crotonobetainyl-CoA:carnitine CoA-transferase CaiB-like acyl-CoA transferase
VVDVSLFESIFRFTDFMALAYDALGTVRERSGSDAHAVPHNHYPTADGKWIAIACTSDRIYQRLAAAMGEGHDEGELAAGPRFATMAGRVAARHEVDARVASWTTRYAVQELCRRLDEAEVPNSPIYSIADIFGDPQYAARGTLVPLDDPVVGRVRVPAPVTRLSETPARALRPAPEAGEHNVEVYGELLGLGVDDIASLRAAGAL